VLEISVGDRFNADTQLSGLIAHILNFDKQGEIAMSIAGIHHTALASVSAGFERIFAGLRAWHAERRDRRALEALSDEQLMDIGYRRVPGDSPDYQRF
jgi:uncharacterized protein YjiS (DUF1127 family)